MVKCANCGTGWTSAGLPLCPVCGTKVPGPVAAKPPEPAPAVPPEIRKEEPASHPYIFPQLKRVEPAPAPEAPARKNGSAVLEVPPEIRKEEPASHPYVFPQLKRVEPAPLIAPTPAPVPVVKKEASVEVESRLHLLDASAATVPVQRDLPSPARPLNGPLILGVLALIPVLAIPLTFVFEGTRVLGILGFCLAGFFAPFAPIAWMMGLGAEKRRREQGLRSERQVSIGRFLGQAATMLLVAEMTVSLIGIAALRLSGKFPNTFWSYF
jgi:hypothetical protein